MRLRKTDLIHGITAERVRTAFREIMRRSFVAQAWVAQVFSVKEEAELARLTASLISEQYLEPFSNRPGYFRLGPLGTRIARASFGKPVSRAALDRAVWDLRKRIHNLNAGDFILTVRHAYLFGSYIDPSQSKGAEVDVALDLVERLPPVGMDRLTHLRLTTERLERDLGTRFRGDDAYFGAYAHCKRYLKGGSRLISLHAIDDEAFENAHPANTQWLYSSPNALPIDECILLAQLASTGKINVEHQFRGLTPPEWDHLRNGGHLMPTTWASGT